MEVPLPKKKRKRIGVSRLGGTFAFRCFHSNTYFCDTAEAVSQTENARVTDPLRNDDDLTAAAGWENDDTP